MKRFLIVFLSMLLVVGFGASAFALHGKEAGFEYQPKIVTAKQAQVTIGGELRFRGLYEDTDFDSDDDDENAWYDGRVQLNIQAAISPNTMGVVELETGGTKDDVYKWGAESSGARGIYQEGNEKIGDLTIRQAYVAHQGKGFGTLAGFKVGHMTVKVGDGLFLNHAKMGDDGIVLWLSPSKGTELSLTTLKLTEGSTANDADDEADLYVLGLEAALTGAKLGADVSFLNDKNGAGFVASSEGIELWNIGVRGEAALAGLTIRGALEVQAGQADDPAGETDFDGWAVVVGADAKVGNANVGAEFAYGSGDEADTSDYEGFVTSLSSGQKYTWVYDYRVITAAGATNTGLANTWYVKVGASVQATPVAKLGVDFYYLGADEDVSLNGGDASDDLGVEIDGKFEYQVDSNLVYFITGGYLFAGDAYDFPTEEADNVYSVAHGVTYKF